MKTWITADWHLGEDRFQLMGRPFSSFDEMIVCLIENHNKLVMPNDEVIMVGDVCYQKTPEFLPWVAKFNGRKTLVRGNHDRVFTDEQLKPYFHTIYSDGEGFVLDANGTSYYVTHYPTRGRSDMFNLVGHIHGAWKYQLNMLNIGVDVHHFYPINIDTIPFHFTALSKFYDDDVWVAYQNVNAEYKGVRGKSGTYFNPVPV